MMIDARKPKIIQILFRKQTLVTMLIILFLLSCSIFNRLDLNSPNSELELDGMRRGMMRHGMGPGMMRFQSPPPPKVETEPTATPGGQATVSYRLDIQPIFNQQCVTCHGGSAGLWLDSYERALLGSSNGPIIVSGNPESSSLYLRITGSHQPLMPLGGESLRPNEINSIRTWIAEGAPNN